VFARFYEIPFPWLAIPPNFSGAIIFGLSGYHVWNLHHRKVNWSFFALAFMMWIHGASTASYPFTRMTWYAPYGFSLFALLASTIGMTLMVAALREEQRDLINEITARKAAEGIRERSLIIIENLLSNSPTGIIVFEGDRGNCVLANQAIADIVGGSIDKIRLQTFRSFASWLDSGLDKLAELTLSNGITRYHNSIFQSSFGKNVAIECFFTRFNVESKSYLLFMASDIAERKLAEETRLLLTVAIEQAGETVIITDMNGIIQYVNPMFETVTGYSRAEVVGQNPRILKSDKQNEAFYHELWDTITSGRVWNGRFVNRKKDGSHYTEDATISPVHDNDGRIVSFVAVKRDISETLRAFEEKANLENQLRHAQKMESIGTLAGGIAHDFNNILSAIIGYGHIALMKMAKDDSRRLNIQYMLDAADRAAHLTKDLLLISRKQVSKRRPVDLNDIIRKLEKFLKRVISEDIDCRTMLRNEQLTILGDDHQLEQVFINLAINAKDAMSKGGVFSITTEQVKLDDKFISVHGYGKSGNYVLTTISDTGTGMDAVTREHIFEPFFTTKEVGKGTGLGLAVVYGIIKQHEAFINVYSEPGLGTTFKIYLPLISEQVDDTIAVVEDCPTGGLETILLAEDDEIVRSMTRTVLEQFGYTVIVAVDGDDAVKKYQENKDIINLLLFDIVMPNKTGKEAYDEIKAFAPEVKVLFASGYAPDMVRLKVLLEDGIPIVYKPISPTALSKQVRAALNSRILCRQS
jgi:PAS domain S-box-containing protein